MDAFLSETSIVDAIVALVAVEGLVLIAWRARTGGGLPIIGALANLSSGAALLLALRMALSGGSSTSVLTFLSVALAAHIADLASRWEPASSRHSSRPDGDPSPVRSPVDSFGTVSRPL